ncbi:MAG: flap endonuclease [Clostridia bacterium]|nr:flap endonuclease [Clostridia bacterium]
MFYGMPARIVNHEGKAIQGTLGFTGALLKIIRMTEPTHIAVIFDGEHENARTELDTEYKSNRPDYSQMPEEDTPFSQLPDIYAALDHLGIRHTETTDVETDDILAGYALTYGESMNIVISSFDSDFFQLITENVSVLRYRGEKTVLCTPAYIKEKFGITPAQYADLKSMTGDTADNIRGAEKVGPKTAAALLNEFGTLENIIASAEQIAKPSIRASVIRNAERLRTNYRLIRLQNIPALPFPLDDLQYTLPAITTNEVLKNIGLK